MKLFGAVGITLVLRLTLYTRGVSQFVFYLDLEVIAAGGFMAAVAGVVTASFNNMALDTLYRYAPEVGQNATDVEMKKKT